MEIFDGTRVLNAFRAHATTAGRSNPAVETGQQSDVTAGRGTREAWEPDSPDGGEGAKYWLQVLTEIKNLAASVLNSSSASPTAVDNSEVTALSASGQLRVMRAMAPRRSSIATGALASWKAVLSTALDLGS